MTLDFIYNTVFLIVSIYILVKSISYALYEIKSENNKSGGIIIISFSTFVVIFSNIMVWTR